MDDVKGLERSRYDSYVEEIDENVDLDEPTAFLDHVHLGCAQHECKPNDIIIEKITQMFETRKLC